MSIVLWLGFILFILSMLYVDLYVINRDAHVVSTQQAFRWTGFCILLAFVFNAFVYFVYEHQLFGMGAGDFSPVDGRDAALKFFSGWLIEQSLSLDNIFVIAIIFSYFRVPAAFQHRVLFWGIIGALIMRGAMIGVGAALITRFEWFTYVFGGLLILTAGKMLVSDDQEVDPERNPLIRIARKFFPVSLEFEGTRFFTHLADGRRAMTPLFLVLLVIESTDLLFAFDSVPAIFAITTDPFLVFTSNIFAILNLRSLYFVLASIIDKFRYMKFSLVFVLAFVGLKMVLAHLYPIPTGISLAVIVAFLGIGLIASLVSTNERLSSRLSRAQAAFRESAFVVIVVLISVLAVGAAIVAFPAHTLGVIIAGFFLLCGEFLWAGSRMRRSRRDV